MAFLAPDIELQKLWEERSQQPEMKMRDMAYKTYENAYLSRTADGERQNVAWRPIMLDGQTSDTAGREPINLAKQFGLHHTSAMARPPRTWNEPGPGGEDVSQKNTALIHRVFRESEIRLLQVKQAYHLAANGDAVYGLAYDRGEDARRRCWVRVVKPIHCYPAIDDAEAPGALKDNLITYEVRKGWAERAYGIVVPQNKSTVRVYEYWDDEYRLIQVEKVKVHHMTVHHELGFVPWYWCFNQVPGMFAQADIAETPKIQGAMNELWILGQDAVRRNVDKAYYAVGHKGTVQPQPGKAVGFPNPNTRIDEFPTAAPPQMITQFMAYAQGHAQAMAGISPISSEGMIEGSNVTGSAIRHQVEAIEARAESKRAAVEAAYSWLGEHILNIYEQKLGDHQLRLRIGEQEVSHSGDRVGDWKHCLASYGSFEGLATMDRGNWAMQGLGRVHGRRTAIALAYPERDVESMEREIDAYQLDQAVLTAKAQAAAQEVLQSGQEPGAANPAPGPGGQATGRAAPHAPPVQMPQRPPEPGIAKMGKPATLDDLKLLLRLLQGKLRGDVYAVGEMAIVGMAIVPEVAVVEDRDLPLVQSTLAPKRAMVRIGVVDDEPKVLISE